MQITTLDVEGMVVAMYSMRNPMNSWERSDTIFGPRGDDELYGGDEPIYKILDSNEVFVGEKDKELSLKLQKAGPEHCKHLRMVMCWADIQAPRYWWQEFDTYRFGVEKVSCSTMHKITSRELTDDDFEIGRDNSLAYDMVRIEKAMVNAMIERYKHEEDPEKKKKIWDAIIKSLPQSYIQKRTAMMSYAALRNIVRQREGHKLKEWQDFVDWAHTLPESWMIFDE